MEKTGITKRQKKILEIVVIIAAAFALFVIFIYLPLRREFVKVKGEFQTTETEVNQIRKMAGGKKSLEETILSLRSRLDSLDKKFPKEDEVVLRELSSLLARLNIEVTSFRPERKSVITDMENAPLPAIKGCSIQEMPILLSLKTSYKKAGEFFRALKQDFPIYVRVNSIRIKKIQDKSELLDIDIDLDTYLVCPKTR